MLSTIAIVRYRHCKPCSWSLGYCCLMQFFYNGVTAVLSIIICVLLDMMQRDFVREFCFLFFSLLLTGLSNLPGEVSASSKLSPQWQYLHWPWSTLKASLPFLSHCLERCLLCCGKRWQGRGQTPAVALSLWTVIPLLSVWIGWSWRFLVSKRLSHFVAVVLMWGRKKSQDPF